MSHCLERLSIGSLVGVGESLTDQLLFGERVPSFGEPCEVFRTNIAAQPEMYGETTLPFTADVFTLSVVHLRRLVTPRGIFAPGSS